MMKSASMLWAGAVKKSGNGTGCSRAGVVASTSFYYANLEQGSGSKGGACGLGGWRSWKKGDRELEWKLDCCSGGIMNRVEPCHTTFLLLMRIFGQ